MNSVSVNGKSYRYGYTTGTCSAAATKAAVRMLLKQQAVPTVQLRLPVGSMATLPVQTGTFSPQAASCWVVKDAGDDPDVTNGIEIHATATWNNNGKLEIAAGIGIGTVTKPGLQVLPGQAAINPVPMQQIREALNSEAQECDGERGITVTLSVPKGEEVAKQTLNSKLGILGGISILGTSGIVKPMSEEAFKNALAAEISVLKAQTNDMVVFVLGNYGKRFVEKHYPALQNRVIVISNFVGFMLFAAVEHHFQKVLIVGNLGKLVKVAGGIFHTHSKVADARNEVLAAHYMLHCGNAKAFREIMQSNTTDDALDSIHSNTFFPHFSATIQQRCQEHVKGKLEVEVVLFSLKAGLLGQTPNVEQWAETYAKPNSL